MSARIRLAQPGSLRLVAPSPCALCGAAPLPGAIPLAFLETGAGSFDVCAACAALGHAGLAERGKGDIEPLDISSLRRLNELATRETRQLRNGAERSLSEEHPHHRTGKE